MVTIIRKPSWAIAEALATPEDAYFNRRALLKTMGFGALALAGAKAGIGAAKAEDASDLTADLYPAPRNTAYTLDRDLTPEAFNLEYNNFYEFGSHKKIAEAAQALKTQPWEIKIDGLVETPMTIGFDDLVRKMTLEERLYRHRCVEAWSMTVPWTGFAMADLVAFAKPLGSAKYIRMETFHDPAMASGQKQAWYPWPYVEGVTIAEATNELAFMVTGAYGKPVAKQMGAPIRLALPWKYGFKSIKSITRISFTEEQPVSFWQTVAPSEYGFWANVNPGVPHRRWNQHQERLLGTGLFRNTLMFNGYGEQVASLYDGMEGQKIYF